MLPRPAAPDRPLTNTRARVGRAMFTLIAIVLAAAPFGCATGVYDTSFYYEPRPAEMAIRFDDGAAADGARALVVVRGVRRADEVTGDPPGVEVMWDLRNDTDQSLTMRGASMRMSAANLEVFPPPKLDSESGVIEVPPRESRTVRAVFPFPGAEYPGSFDLSGLNVQWSVETGGRAATDSVTFHRRRIYRPAPTWSYAYPYGRHCRGWWISSRAGVCE